MFKQILIVLIAFVFISGCTDRFKTKEELFEKGVKHAGENDPGSAIIYFKNALEKDPNYSEARFQLAKSYISAGKLESAENELLKLRRQKTNGKEVTIELARIYVFTAKPDEALKELHAYIGDASDDAAALEIAGGAYALKGEYVKAAELLNKALSADAPGPSAGITLSKVYMKMGKPEEARAQIAKILEKDAANKDALYALAEFQMAENRLDEAIKTYDQISGNDPSEFEARFRKGAILIQKGSYDEALSVADDVIGKFPKRPDGYRLKGIALFYKKNFNDATIALQKSISIQPSIGAYYFLGLCHYNKNEVEQAFTQFQAALNISPAFTPARMLSSIILLRKNKPDDAVAEIGRVLETDPKNALAHNILGSAYMTKGLYEKGLVELNKAIDIDPNLVDVHIKKGLFELSRGKANEAESELKTAVQVAPDMLYSRALLASSYLKRGEFDKAMNTLKQGIKGQKADAFLYTFMAEVYLRQNKADEAFRNLQKAKETDPEYDAPYFNLAALYFRKGEQDKGIQELKSLVGKTPGNINALLILASVYENKGSHDEAFQYYVRAKGTGKTEGSIELAKYHLRKKENDKAMQVLDESIKKNPSDAVGYEFKGVTLMSLKNFEDAVKTFEALEKVNPDSAVRHLVNAYIAMKKPEKALERIRKEINRKPRQPELMAEASRIYKIMGKKQEAVENAKQITLQHPQSPVGYMTLAFIYQDDKEFDKAIDALLAASSLKDVNIAMMLGNLYFLKKDYTGALTQFRRAEDIQTGYVPAIFQRGAVFHGMGKKQEAIDQYQRALRFAQNHIPTLNNLAYLYAEDNRDLSMALQLATKAYTLAPQDGFVQDTLGFVLLKNGKVQEAADALKRAAELLPDNPTVHYHLALALRQQGDRVKAVESLKKALQIGYFPEAEQAKTMLSQLNR